MHSNFTIYNASAGSGKTYTITKEYLTILLSEPHPFAFQFILAVTFTNKAASEMKSRILNTLIGFSGLDDTKLDTHLLMDISAHVNITKEEAQKRSYSILKQLINNYADFEVSTIDSFNHRIIRTFARDLRIAQNFSIQLETADYITKAVDQLIEELGQDEELTSWLSDFVLFKIKNNTSGDIRKQLYDFAELVLNENNYPYLKHLQSIGFEDFKKAKQTIVERRTFLKQKIKEIRDNFFEVLNTNNIAPKSFPRQTIPKMFNNAADENINGALGYSEDSIHEVQFYNKSVKQDEKDRIDGLRTRIEQSILNLKNTYYELCVLNRVLKSVTPLAMIGQIQKKLNAIKEEEEVLFVNDFNRLISQQVIKQPAPFIYERLGEKFRHYFIDEFQDTSKLQWHNFIPLAEHALSSEDFNSQGSSLYLVGDVKQSIYEWRGGDPELLMDLYFKTKNPFTIKPTNEELNNNWRSDQNIVDFNNQFFELSAKELSDTDHRNIYQNVKQNAKSKEEGYVEIKFLEDEKDKGILSENRIEEVMRIVKTSQSQGYSLGDICILVRTNKNGLELVEALNALENPIPVVSQESLLIKNDVKVELLISFLYLITSFSEDTKVDFLLKWFQYNKIDSLVIHQHIQELYKLDKNTFFKSISKHGIAFRPDDYISLPMYSKTEYCLKCLSFDKCMNAYIQFLLDEIFKFSNTTSQNIAEFLKHWENNKNKLSISTPESSNAIKIMTIHKSKGLQFPIVIYAFANFQFSKLKRTKDWILLDEDKYGLPLYYENISDAIKHLNEEFSSVYNKNVKKTELANINTAYVSMTRAEKQLYILVDPAQDKRNLDFRTLLIKFLQSKGMYNAEETLYKLGSVQPKTTAITYVAEDKSYDFNLHLSKRFYSTLTSEDHLNQDLLESKAYGIKIHKAFENITYAKDFLENNNNSPYKDEIEQVLTNPEISEYFSQPWQIHNEIDIALNGEILRLDRLCLHQEKAVIIDYKTGAENQKDNLQITNYKKAIEALGYTEIKAYLVYLREKIFVKSI